MKIDIRQNIINNFKNDNFKTLKEAIDESVEKKEELTLPGLGVFFELLWKNSDQEFKNNIVETIRKSVRKGLDNNI